APPRPGFAPGGGTHCQQPRLAPDGLGVFAINGRARQATSSPGSNTLAPKTAAPKTAALDEIIRYNRGLTTSAHRPFDQRTCPVEGSERRGPHALGVQRRIA